MKTHAAIRFWMKVDTSAGPAECWPWTARRFESGHGCFVAETTPSQRQQGAHRWVMIQLNGGIIDDKEVVCHKCDNPPCCNPAHLYIGSQWQNIQDREARGRSGSGRKNAIKTHCPRDHEYTTENTRLYRGCRTCKTCNRIRDRERRAELRGR